MTRWWRTLRDIILGRAEPDAQPAARPAWPDDALRPRVRVVVYNPTVPSRDGQRLTDLYRFADPNTLVRGYVADLAEASSGYLQYQVMSLTEIDSLPRKTDGFRYTGDHWTDCWERRGGWHDPDLADYPALLAAHDAPREIMTGSLDELWLFGPPYAGFWESTMAGAGAFWCNSPPVTGIACPRRFVVMGFNYERGVGEMLENFGHRVESVLARAYRDEPAGHAWERFCAYEAVAPGRAACGNVHFAPNSVRDYDWGNRTPVWSTCDDWPYYPHLQGRRRLVDCREWGGGGIRGHHRWWLAHLPRTAGSSPDGRLANWWTYAVQVERDFAAEQV